MEEHGHIDDDEWSCVLEEDKIYVDKRTAKEENHVCIRVGTVGCWSNANTVEFKQWAIGGDCDVILLNELGKNWTAVQEDKKLESIVRIWCMQTYTKKSWLKTPKAEKEHDESQYGGAAVLSKMINWQAPCISLEGMTRTLEDGHGPR